MDPKFATIVEIIPNGSLTQLEIPFFQRAYVWKEPEWERFFEDITKTALLSSPPSPHFFGTLILKEKELHSNSDNINKIFSVIDGQQRITTFFIFFKALCMKINASTYFESIFQNIYSDNGPICNLKVSRNDQKNFEKIIEATDDKKIENTNDSLLIKAYNYFLDKIEENKIEDKNKNHIYNVIMNKSKFMALYLNKEENEQEIFDCINSLGVDLTTSELLKNYFFDESTISQYEETWVPVFENNKETVNYWGTELEIGRRNRALSELFFYAYFQIVTKTNKFTLSDEEKIQYDKLENLFNSYKDFIKKHCNNEKNSVLDEICSYAATFHKIFNPSICNDSIPSEYGIERINLIIFGLKNSSLVPVILYIAHNVKNKEELKKMYGLIETYMARRLIVNATTKNYNNFFKQIISKQCLSYESLLTYFNSYEADSTTYFPSDKDIENGIKYSKLINLQSKGILYLLESGIRSPNQSTEIKGFNFYSLEHLLPKKWRNHWHRIYKTDNSIDEENEKKRDSTLLTLGNLAIIQGKLNSSLSDSDWQTKLDGKNNKEGLKKCAAGLEIMEEVLKKDHWDEAAIESRANWLLEKAKKIWSIK